MRERMDSLWLAGAALAVIWILTWLMPSQPADGQGAPGLFRAEYVQVDEAALKSENEYIYRQVRNPADHH
ncbi:hypothetical protein O9H32_02930 [Paenibacillus mucilaginosus]|nr:hypothetical protein [Paenibacillus caseinilyticus]